jgi:hypothetical protein
MNPVIFGGFLVDLQMREITAGQKKKKKKKKVVFKLTHRFKK